MPDITCYLAELNVSAYPQVADALPLGGQTLSSFFQTASMLPSKTPAINLTLNPSLRHSLTPETPMGTGDVELQDALAQITKAAGAGNDPKVALLLADYYTGNLDAYGFMFDLDLIGPTYGPRQGCAVFLEKIHTVIRDASKNDQDFCDLVAYTAIHELGHVFNLWHVPAPPSFMTPCPPSDISTACSFVPDENTYLQNAANPDVANYVMPGGSAFNDRGAIGPSTGDGSFLLATTPPKLRLQIALQQAQFWHFEPVELDVRLSLANQKSGNAEIPDQIDPGYESCAIWITRPDGERFRYRPSIRFCGSQKIRCISRNRPFERDISIFRQSGGYTFAMSGRYEIQMVLKLTAQASLASNIVSFEVLRAEPRSREYSATEKAFMSDEAGKLLRYKSRLPAAADYARLRQFAIRYKSTASACAIHYSLGRVLMNFAKRETDKTRSNRALKQGLFHLDKAANHPHLSKHRRIRIEQLVTDAADSSSENQRA